MSDIFGMAVVLTFSNRNFENWPTGTSLVARGGFAALFGGRGLRATIYLLKHPPGPPGPPLKFSVDLVGSFGRL